MYNSSAASSFDNCRRDVRYLFNPWNASSHSSSHLSLCALLMALKKVLHWLVDLERKRLSAAELSHELILIVFSDWSGSRMMYSSSSSSFQYFSFVDVSSWAPSSWFGYCGCYLVADLSFWTSVALARVNDFFFDSYSICTMHHQDAAGLTWFLRLILPYAESDFLVLDEGYNAQFH